LAEKILENVREKQSNKGAEQENEETKEKIILSKRIEEKDEEIGALENEQKILRGMATSGIVAGHHKKVSFLWQELPYQLQVCSIFVELSV
jgi:hypothetical protein